MDLQIFKKDNSILNGAILKKYTFQKAYGSFDSKISGTFVYEGKGLDETMLLGCYVIYGGMKYTIINAPTSESFLYVRDNNGLNGCNRYSCEFFAPEYFLTQYEFRDFPLDENESLYRGGQTTFFLCSSIDELIKRIQANLDVYNFYIPEGDGKWEIILQGKNKGTPQIDPIQFDNNSIADVLQKIEEVYNLHFFIQYHPSPTGSDANAIIYIGDIVQTMPSGTVFDFGQDVGLTSSIRVSKREPMITKLYPRGSTHNVPFRYPVFRDLTTITPQNPLGDVINHSYYSERLMPQYWVDAVKKKVVDKIDTPIIEYILSQNPPALPHPDGTPTNFVNEYNPKTPFVEHIDYEDVHPTIKEMTHLGKRVDKLREDSIGDIVYIRKELNSNIKDNQYGQYIVDYAEKPYFYIVFELPIKGYGDGFSYDYVNLLKKGTIGSFIKARIWDDNTNSYQTNPFKVFDYYDIDDDYKNSFIDNGVWNPNKPTRDYTKFPSGEIVGRFELPLKKKALKPYSTWFSLYPREKDTSTTLYNDWNLLKNHTVLFAYENELTHQIYEFWYNIIDDAAQEYVKIINEFIDDIDVKDGTLKQSHFLLPLNILGFDLFASAIENEEMFIHMTSGSCQGSRFKIAVDWDDWVRNFNINNVFTGRRLISEYPTNPTNYITYPDTTYSEIKLRVYKDIETWGQNFVQPTALRYPKAGDTFVITGINLPDKYVENAQKQLQIRGLADLIDKNIEKFDYQFNISNIFLENHIDYKEYLDTNIKINFKYNNIIYVSNFATISIEYGGVLPRYDVKLSDVLESRVVGSKGMGSIISLISDMLGEAIGSIQSNEIRRMFNQFMTFPDRRQQITTNEIQRSIQNNNLIISNQNNLIQENQNEIANNASQISNINALLLDLENNRPFIYTGDVIEFNNIKEIKSLPYDDPYYIIDMLDLQGIVIYAGNFLAIEESYPYKVDYDIRLDNLEIGQQKYISILYPLIFPIPLLSYYKFTFHANNIKFIVEINGKEDYPITRVLFVNNGKFVEAYAVKGYRDSIGLVQDIIPTN